MIRTLPVDTSRMTIVATGHCAAVGEWVQLADGSSRPSGNQKKDEASGLPLWVLDLMLVVEGERAEVIGVQVPASVEPETLAPLSPVTVTGLVARFSKGRDGNLRSYWSAETVSTAQAAPVRSVRGAEQAS